MSRISEVPCFAQLVSQVCALKGLIGRGGIMSEPPLFIKPSNTNDHHTLSLQSAIFVCSLFFMKTYMQTAYSFLKEREK